CPGSLTEPLWLDDPGGGLSRVLRLLLGLLEVLGHMGTVPLCHHRRRHGLLPERDPRARHLLPPRRHPPVPGRRRRGPSFSPPLVVRGRVGLGALNPH